jgi:hypothetical protein
MTTTGLRNDVAQVLERLQKVAERLSVAERDVIEETCSDVLQICEDEERQAAVTVRLLNETMDELEDK